MSLTYKIPSNQSIYDSLVTVEVSVNDIVSVLEASDLDLNSDLFGEDLIYEASQISKPKGGQIAITSTPEALQYITNSSQNIYDVCLMTLGDINKIVSLISSNEIFNNINDAPNGVKVVNFNNSDITDSGFILSLKKAKIDITTGNEQSEESVETFFLLMESGDHLLLEDGFKIIL